MRDFLSRVTSLGVGPDTQALEIRRIRTITFVCLVAIATNLFYVVFLSILDFSAFSGLVINNIVVGGLVAVGIWLNSRGHTNVAASVLSVLAIENTVLAALVLGSGTGAFLFVLLFPFIGVLIAPPGGWRVPAFFVVVGVVALVVVVLVDPASPRPISGTGWETALLVSNALVTVLFLSGVALYFKGIADRAEAELLIAHEESERLLLNILPTDIAQRLKAGESVIADRIDGVTILFADLVGSTAMSERISPAQMVEVLNGIFTPFDDLADSLNLEKIKTIGDAYMVVGGLPVPRPDHVEAVALMALAMRDELQGHEVEGIGRLQMRYGIDTGTVVAGVIGKRKFSYDLWGDTVNTAARMESQGVPGQIQVTEAIYSSLKHSHHFSSRGPVDIRGKGQLHTYMLHGPRDKEHT